MKKIIFLLLYVYLLNTLCARDIVFTQKEKHYIQNNTFDVAMLSDFPPFSIYKNNKLSGFSYNILQLISSKHNIKFNYTVDTWPNNLKKFKENKVDIIDSISFKEKRVAFTNYTEPYYEIPLVIFSRKSFPKYNDIGDLKNKKLGLTKNIFYKDDIKRLNLFKITEYDSFDSKLRALAFGAVDIMFGHLLSTQINITQSGYTNLKVLGEVDLPNIKKTDLRFGIVKNNLTLHSIITKGLQSITQKEWSELKNNWLSIYATQNLSYSDSNIILTPKEQKYIQKKRVLKVQNESDWPPYNFNQDGKPKGFSIDYTNLLAQKLNLKIEYISGYTWNQYLDMLKKKEIDVLNNISKNKQRMSYIDFTKVFHIASNAIYVHKKSKNIDSLSKLNGKTIVMPKGFFAQELLAKYYPKIKQIHVENSLEALKLLSLGKADATIGKKNVLDYIISTNNISGVTPTSYLDDNRITSFIRMGVPKGETILRDLLEKAQNSVTDEQLLNLKRKWFGVKTAQKNKKTEFLNKTDIMYLKTKKVIRFCTGDTNRPIEFRDKKGNVQGIAIDTLKLVANKLNIFIKNIESSSKEEALWNLEEKKCDILTAVNNYTDIMSFSNITNPYLKYQLAIITQKDKPVVSRIENVLDKTIVLEKNSQFISHLKSNYPDIKVIEVENNHKALEYVNNSLAYYTISPLPIASYYMSKFALHELYISRYTNIPYTVHMAVRDDDTRLLKILNKALSNITEEEKRKIFNKWASPSIKEGFDYELFWKILIVIAIVMLILLYRQLILNKHNHLLKDANKEIEKKNIQIEKQKEIFQKVFMKSTDGVILCKINDKYKIIDCNEAALSLFQSNTKIDFLNKSIFALAHYTQVNGNSSKKNIKTKIKEVIIKGSSSFEWFFKTKEDNLFWAEVVLTTISIEDEPVIHIVLRDITQRKEIEQQLASLTNNLERKVYEQLKENEQKTKQLISQSRLAQMGELLNMIAHQWRQPLTSISAISNNLLLKIFLDKPMENKELEEELHLILEYSQHLSTTINDFRSFYNTDKQKESILINELITQTISIVHPSLVENNIKLIKQFDCCTIIYTYLSELKQVILNLLKNSEEVLLEKQTTEPEIIISTSSDENYIYITCSDNGGGIFMDDINSVFDPYFSTKTSKEGSGLGLYMSKTIIEDHCRGKLDVTNGKHGAKFTISLERSETNAKV